MRGHASHHAYGCVSVVVARLACDEPTLTAGSEGGRQETGKFAELFCDAR